MQRLLTGQTGDERLQKLRNAEDIKKLILGSYLDPRTMTQTTPAQAAQYKQLRDPFTGIGTVIETSPAMPATTRTRTNRNIDQLLAQYGIQNPLDLREYGLN